MPALTIPWAIISTNSSSLACSCGESDWLSGFADASPAVLAAFNSSLTASILASSTAPTGVSTFTGNISGTGSVDILGTGKTTFTSNNTYAGITTIHAGSTLQIGNGGSTGAIVGDVVNNGTLVFKRAGTVTYSGTIHDGSTFFPTNGSTNGYSYLYGGETAHAGNLTQAGPGTLILDNSQLQYTGVTKVTAGTLEITSASPTMSLLDSTKTQGVNITGGMLVLDYTTGSDPAFLVESLLEAAAASHFQIGQIRDTDLSAGGMLTWADSPTIDGHTYANEVVIMVATPEPSTLVLLGFGAIGLLAYAWRRQTKPS